MTSTLDTCDKNPSYPATIHSKNRKISMPLRINCNDTSNNEFYDIGSTNDISPTTAVSSKQNLSILEDTLPSRDQSFLNSIKCIPYSILHYFKKGSKKELEMPITNTCLEKSEDYSNNKGNKGKQSQNSSSTQVGKTVRHSYSDPRLSPGSTAVGDDDEERHGYFGVVPEKKKRTPRGWIAAVMMIVVGALIAITFVLVGLGKAIEGSNTSAASQHLSNTTTFHRHSTSTATSSSSSSVLSTNSDIKTTFTLKPTQT